MGRSATGGRRLEVLTHEACVERLADSTVGRMGVAWRGEPHVLPVNYRWVGDAVIVRTDANTHLGKADGQIAVLEIDSVDEQTRTGWSVVVRGRCSALAAPVTEQPSGGDVEQGEQIGPETWAPARRSA